MSNSIPATETAVERIVLVSHAPEAMANLVRHRLARLFPQASISMAGSLASAAAEYPEARLVLAVVDAMESVATRLEVCASQATDTGSIAQAALTDWIEQTAPVLEATRSLRRRLWLVDARAMAEGRPQALSETPEEGVAEMEGAAQITPMPEALSLALAELLIRNDPRASRLAAEITALRRGSGGVTIDLDQACNALAELQRSSSEADLQRETAALVQAELDANVKSLATARRDGAEGDALKEELARLRAELAGHEIQRQEEDLLRETLELIRSELDQAGEDLIVARQERAEFEVLRARFAALERKLSADAEVGHLRQEVLAAEILKMNGIVISERARFADEVHAARAENGQLQGQMQATQAEMAEAHDQLAAAKSAIADLEGQLQTALAEVASLQGQLQAAQEEVVRLHDSTSWRVTAPMRAVKRRLASP